MISEGRLVEEFVASGGRAHCRDGVWWREPYPFHAKPVFDFRPYLPGSVRPARGRSLLGYSHHVPSSALGNHGLEYMVLDGDDLADFGLDRLRGKKRNQVRKGLRSCEIRRVTDVERHLDEIREIYISQSRRHTEYHELPDTPPEFYIEHAALWEAREMRYLSTGGRELWGAFSDSRLVAFLVSSQVEEWRFIEKMKSHSDALNLCPSDALYFSVIEYGARVDGCRRVVNSGGRGRGLDWFKEQFLFKRKTIPVFVSNIRMFRVANRVLGLRRALAGRRAPSRVPTDHLHTS